MPKLDESSAELMPRNYDFLGLRLHDIDNETLARRLSQAVCSRKRMLVLNANAHMATVAQQQTWLKDMFAEADLAVCDGAGVQYATWFLTGLLPRRATPPLWIKSFAGQLPPETSIFWVGGSPEVVERAAKNFADSYNLRNAGTQHGFFDHRVGSPENEALIERINAARPDVVLVNMGMPLQERWLRDVWHRLDAGIAITGGALVDHIAGNVRRPPEFVSNMGLEWLVRLLREPRRLWRRYLLGLPAFGLLVLQARLRTIGKLPLLRRWRTSAAPNGNLFWVMKRGPRDE